MPRRRKTVEEESEESINRGIKILERYKNKMNSDRQKRLNIEPKKEVSSARRIFRFLLVLIIIIIVVLAIQYGPILGIKIINVEAEPIVLDNILSNESIYLEYNNELLIYTDGAVSTYDKNGNRTWQYTLSEGFLPTIYSNGKYLAIANKTNGMLYYFCNKKEVANIGIEGNIENVYVCDDGRFVVQYTKTSGYKKVIAMYNSKAKLLYDEAYINSSPIIGIEFLDNTSKLLVVQADSSQINIGTSFNILDYSNNAEYKNLILFNDKLVYNYKLINDEIIYVCDDAVESYSISKNEKSHIHSLIDSQTNYIALYENYFVTVEMLREGYELTAKKFDDTVISKTMLTSFPKYIEMNQFLTYVVSENYVEVVNKWGVNIDKINISLSPKKIIVFNNEKTVALIYSNKVDIVSI